MTPIKPLPVDAMYNLLPYVVRANDPGSIRLLIGALTQQHNFYADKLARLPELHDPRIAASFSIDDFPDEDPQAFSDWLVHVRNRTEQSVAAQTLAVRCPGLVEAWRHEQQVLGLLGPIVGNAITSRLLVASLRKLIEFSITRHHVKGTAASAAILGRIFGFLEFRIQELWTRYRLTNPADPRASTNDGDFAPAPESSPYWPLGDTYDGNMLALRERTGTSTSTRSERFQLPAGSPDYNPFVLDDGPSRTITFPSLHGELGTNHWSSINALNPFGAFTQPVAMQLASGTYVMHGGTPDARAVAYLPVGQPVAFTSVALAEPFIRVSMVSTGLAVGQVILITLGAYAGLHTIASVGSGYIDVDGTFTVNDAGFVWPHWTPFEALDAGTHGNGVQITVSGDRTSSRYKQITITGVLSRIKYKSSLFNVTMAVDGEAFSLQHPPIPVRANPSASPMDAGVTVLAEVLPVSSVAAMSNGVGGGVLPSPTVTTGMVLLHSNMISGSIFYVIAYGDGSGAAMTTIYVQHGDGSPEYLATPAPTAVTSPVVQVRVDGCTADVLLPAGSFATAAVTVVRLQRYVGAISAASGDLRALPSSHLTGRLLAARERTIEVILTRTGSNYTADAFENGAPVAHATVAPGEATIVLGGGGIDAAVLSIPADLTADGGITVVRISQMRVTADITAVNPAGSQYVLSSLPAQLRIGTFMRVSATPGLNGLRTVVSRRERTGTMYDTVTSVTTMIGTVNGYTATIVDDGSLSIAAAYWDAADQAVSVERHNRDLYVAITGTGTGVTVAAFSDESGTVLPIATSHGNPLLIATSIIGGEMARMLITIPSAAYASGACLLLHIIKQEVPRSGLVADTTISYPPGSAFSFTSLPAIQPSAPGSSAGWPRFVAGRMAGDPPLYGSAYGRLAMADPARDFEFDFTSYSELIAAMRVLFEEIRPITREIRRETVGFLVTDSVRYAPSIRQTSVVLASQNGTRFKLDVVNGTCVWVETTDDLTSVPVQADRGQLVQWAVSNDGVFAPVSTADAAPVLVYIQSVDQRFAGFVTVYNRLLTTSGPAVTDQVCSDPVTAEDSIAADKALVVERQPAQLRRYFSRWADSTDAPQHGWWQQDRPEDEVVAQPFMDDGIATFATDHFADRNVPLEQQWQYDGRDRFVGRDIRNRMCGITAPLIEPPPTGDSVRQDGLYFGYAVGFADFHNSYAWRKRSTNEAMYSEYTFDAPDLHTGATRVDGTRTTLEVVGSQIVQSFRPINVAQADGRIEGASGADDPGFGVTPDHQFGTFEIRPWQAELTRTLSMRSMQSSTAHGATTLLAPAERYAIGQLLRLPSPFAFGNLTVVLSTPDYIRVPTTFASATVAPTMLVAEMQAWPTDTASGISVTISARAGVVSWMVEELTELMVPVTTAASGTLTAPHAITQTITLTRTGYGYLRVWASSADGSVTVQMKRNTPVPTFTDIARPSSAAMFASDRQAVELTIMDDDGNPHPFTFDGYDSDRESWQALQTGVAAWRGGQWADQSADTLTDRSGMGLPAIRS